MTVEQGTATPGEMLYRVITAWDNAYPYGKPWREVSTTVRDEWERRAQLITDARPAAQADEPLPAKVDENYQVLGKEAEAVCLAHRRLVRWMPAPGWWYHAVGWPRSGECQPMRRDNAPLIFVHDGKPSFMNPPVEQRLWAKGHPAPGRRSGHRTPASRQRRHLPLERPSFLMRDAPGIRQEGGCQRWRACRASMTTPPSWLPGSRSRSRWPTW